MAAPRVPGLFSFPTVASPFVKELESDGDGVSHFDDAAVAPCSFLSFLLTFSPFHFHFHLHFCLVFTSLLLSQKSLARERASLHDRVRELEKSLAAAEASRLVRMRLGLIPCLPAHCPARAASHSRNSCRPLESNPPHHHHPNGQARAAACGNATAALAAARSREAALDEASAGLRRRAESLDSREKSLEEVRVRGVCEREGERREQEEKAVGGGVPVPEPILVFASQRCAPAAPSPFCCCCSPSSLPRLLSLSGTSSFSHLAPATPHENPLPLPVIDLSGQARSELESWRSLLSAAEDAVRVKDKMLDSANAHVRLLPFVPALVFHFLPRRSSFR